MNDFKRVMRKDKILQQLIARSAHSLNSAIFRIRGGVEFPTRSIRPIDEKTTSPTVRSISTLGLFQSTLSSATDRSFNMWYKR